MLKNYLTIAWRNLMVHRLFSAINVLGLAIGLACSILIVLFVRYEMSYDQHYTNADRIVRVVRHFTTMNLHLATTAPPIGPLLETDFPEVEAMTRVSRGRVRVEPPRGRSSIACRQTATRSSVPTFRIFCCSRCKGMWATRRKT